MQLYDHNDPLLVVNNLKTMRSTIIPVVFQLVVSWTATHTSSDGGKPTSCEEICQDLKECRHGHQGSYCKTGEVPTCFGLFEKHDGGLCYFPEDSSCDQSQPILCPGTNSTVTTTEPTKSIGESTTVTEEVSTTKPNESTEQSGTTTMATSESSTMTEGESTSSETQASPTTETLPTTETQVPSTENLPTTKSLAPSTESSTGEGSEATLQAAGTSETSNLGPSV